MAQKALVVVIDEFSAAVAAMAVHVPPETLARLNAATGDLLEGLATAAQEQASSAALSVLNGMEAITAELQAVRVRLMEDEASTAHTEGMLIDLAEQGRDGQMQTEVRLGIAEAAITTTAHELQEHIDGEEES